MNMERKYLSNVMRIQYNQSVERGGSRLSAAESGAKNQEDLSLLGKASEQGSFLRLGKLDLGGGEAIGSQVAGAVRCSKNTGNQRYESPLLDNVDRVDRIGDQHMDGQADGRQDLADSEDSKPTQLLPEFKKAKPAAANRTGMAVSFDQQNIKTPYLLKQNISVHNHNNKPKTTVYKQNSYTSNYRTRKGEPFSTQQRLEEGQSQRPGEGAEHQVELVAVQDAMTQKQRSLSSFSGQQQSLRVLQKLDSSRKEQPVLDGPVLSGQRQPQRLGGSRMPHEAAARKNLERAGSQVQGTTTSSYRPSHKLSNFAQSYLRSAHEGVSKAGDEEQREASRVLRSHFHSNTDELDTASVLPSIKQKADNGSYHHSGRKGPARSSLPSAAAPDLEEEQRRSGHDMELLQHSQGDLKHNESDFDSGAQPISKKAKTDAHRAPAHSQPPSKTLSIPQLKARKVHLKAAGIQAQQDSIKMQQNAQRARESLGEQAREQSPLHHQAEYGDPPESYRRRAVESQEVVLGGAKAKTDQLFGEDGSLRISKEAVAGKEIDIEDQESLDDVGEDEKLNEAPYDRSSIERTDAKARQSRAKNERMRLNHNALVRERDLLRDWTKRTAQKQETDYGQAYTAYTQTVNNRVRQSQNDYAPASPFAHSSFKRSTADGASLGQETKQAAAQYATEPVVSDHIVFQSNARDTYFKRAALRKQASEGIWLENPVPSSHFFTVKWDYGDSSFDHNKVKPHQFFNHFPDTRELTTKQGLNKNLNAITAPGVDVASFYPRCFDLSDPRQLDLFISDFNQTSILNCIQKHAEYFGSLLKEQELDIQNIFSTNLQIGLNFDKNKFRMLERQKAIKRQLESIEFYLTDKNTGYINIFLLQQALFHCQSLLNQTIGIDKESEHTDDLFKKSCFLPVYSTSHQVQEFLQNYSAYDLPIQLESVETKGMSKLRRLRGWMPVTSSNCQGRGPSPLNPYLIYLTIKMSKTLEQHWPQYGAVNGSQNVWICKPCYNARGLGIFCFNQKSDIINTFSKKAPAPKVVQKYIERPLLLKNLNPRATSDLRKFDIRQWVLVASVEPLQVYVYKKAYLRICGSHYNIKQYDDPIRHLSNYSIQKKEVKEDHGFDEIEEKLLAAAGIQKVSEAAPRDASNTKQQQNFEFVMSTDTFISKLNKEYPELEASGPYTWETTFYDQIKDITSKVFGRMSEVMEQKPSSFELYGLDFVIDQNLKCWLIEANMSPACAHRRGQEWLTEMTEDMADGMLNIIEQKIIKNMASQQVEYNGGLAEKITECRAGNLRADIKGWDRLVFEGQKAATRTKQPQKQACQLRNIGSNVPGVRALANQTLQRQTASGKNAFLNLHQDNLEIHGTPANLKFERKMDRRYRKFQAALLIQRVWRGSQVRAKFEHQAIIDLQKKLGANNLIKILIDHVDKLQAQKQAQSPLEHAFEALRIQAWEERILENEDKILKVIKIQRAFRKVMCVDVGDSVLAETLPAGTSSKYDIGEDATMNAGRLQVREESFASTDNELDPYGLASASSSPGQDGRKQEENEWNREMAPELRLAEKQYATQSQRRLQVAKTKANDSLAKQLQLRSRASQSFVATSRRGTEEDSDSGREMTKEEVMFASKTPARKQSVHRVTKKTKREAKLQAFQTTQTGRAFGMKTKKKSTALKSKERKQRAHHSPSSWYPSTAGYKQLDPDLLLNYYNLGLDMIIPTSGTYFQMRGGMVMRRMHPENPVIEQDRLLQAQHALQIAPAAEKGNEVAQCTVQSIQQIYQKQSPQKKQPKKSTAAAASVYDVYTDAASRVMPGLKARTAQNAHHGRDGTSTQAGFVPSGSKHEQQRTNSRSGEKLSQRAPIKNFSNPAIMRRIQDCYQVAASMPTNYVPRANHDDRYSTSKKTVAAGSSQKQSSNGKLIAAQGRGGGIWAAGLTSHRKQQPMASPYLWSTAYKETSIPASSTAPLLGPASSLSTGPPGPETEPQVYPRHLFTTNYRSAESQSQLDGKGLAQRLQNHELDHQFFKKRSIIQTQKLPAAGKLDSAASAHESRDGAVPPLASLPGHGRKPRGAEEPRLFERVLHPTLTTNTVTCKSQTHSSSHGLHRQPQSRKGQRAAPTEGAVMMPQIQKMMKWC